MVVCVYACPAEDAEMPIDAKIPIEGTDKAAELTWSQQIRNLWSKESEVHGLLRVFDSTLVALRFVSVSYVLKDVVLPTLWAWRATSSGRQADAKKMRLCRDALIDFYCICQLPLLLFSEHFFSLSVSGILAIYIVFEIYLNLLSIFFVPRRKTIGPTKPGEKPSAINEPSTSIERNILLVFVNVIELVVAFAIFYKYLTPTLHFRDALFDAVLVFGTVGYSDHAEHRVLVAVQILLNFVLIVTILGGFVSQVTPFTKHKKDEDGNDGKASG